MLAKHKMEVERQLRNLTDLNYLVLRPATVYGLGDKNGLGEMSQDIQLHVYWLNLSTWLSCFNEGDIVLFGYVGVSMYIVYNLLAKWLIPNKRLIKMI